MSKKLIIQKTLLLIFISLPICQAKPRALTVDSSDRLSKSSKSSPVQSSNPSIHPRSNEFNSVHGLEHIFLKNKLSALELKQLKVSVLKLANRAVPLLIDVMKSDKYPEKNRWHATFLMGQIMGKKATPFISKFLTHPKWSLRLASLKSLLALKEKNLPYQNLLSDSSLLVRFQTLENIEKLKLTEHGSLVWSMLSKKDNYKHPELVKKVIHTLGKLQYKRALLPFISLLNQPKYKMVFNDIHDALEGITKQKVQSTDLNARRIFWNKYKRNNKLALNN